MEKLKIKKIVLGTGLLLVFISIILPIFQVSAQTPDNTYTVLAPLPGVGDKGGTTTLQEYVPAIFKLAIGLSAVFAVLMIVIGGFQYISSDAIMKKSEGKERIKNAVLGLVLVISAWLILNTINPGLLKFSLDISPATTTAVPTGGEGTLTGGGPKAGSSDILTGSALAQDAEVRKNLTGIGVNKSACTAVGVACTNLNGLPTEMVTALKSFNSDCDSFWSDCAVLITGGTETYAHASHGPGKSIVDINPTTEINKYLGITSPTSGSHSERNVTGGKLVFTYENTGDNGRATAPHWHVVFVPK